MKSIDLKALMSGFKKKDITSLAKAITLVESKNQDHQISASLLLENLSDINLGASKIIGISGTPGVGKSTFIESFGKYLTNKKLSVAVLAIDPTSQLTGGSILGDKTRMNELAIDPLSFIRPSPSGDTLGGVATKTRESIRLCEAFGFDIIIVETVGVGQSEVAVSKIVDFFLLLMQPGGGDDLQGIKRGILELADLVCINKADGSLLSAAKLAKAEYESALNILRSHEDVQILLCSAIEKVGFEDIWSNMNSFYTDKSELIEKRKLNQKSDWFDELLLEKIKNQFLNNSNAKTKIDMAKDKLINNKGSLKIIVDTVFNDITKARND